MFTPTPPTRPQASSEPSQIAWEVVKLEMVTGPRGKAVVAWMAARAPLRMEFRVGKRTFKSAADAHDYAQQIVGSNET
jgi:hypothetical protein